MCKREAAEMLTSAGKLVGDVGKKILMLYVLCDAEAPIWSMGQIWAK